VAMAAAAASESELPARVTAARRGTAKKATMLKLSPAVTQTAPDVQALVPTFELLQELVTQSVVALQTLGNQRRDDMLTLGSRLRELVPLLLPNGQGSGAPPNSLVFSEGASEVKGTSEASLWILQQPTLPATPRSGDAKRHRQLLRQWMHEHTQLTRGLRKLVRDAQDAGSLAAVGAISPATSPRGATSPRAATLTNDSLAAAPEIMVWL